MKNTNNSDKGQKDDETKESTNFLAFAVTLTIVAIIIIACIPLFGNLGM